MKLADIIIVGNKAYRKQKENKMKEFVEYVASFYEADKGIYAEDFTPRVHRAEIEAAATLVAVRGELGLRAPFEGDSIDREEVRAVLEATRSNFLF